MQMFANCYRFVLQAVDNCMFSCRGGAPGSFHGQWRDTSHLSKVPGTTRPCDSKPKRPRDCKDHGAMFIYAGKVAAEASQTNGQIGASRMMGKTMTSMSNASIAPMLGKGKARASVVTCKHFITTYSNFMQSALIFQSNLIESNQI